MGKKNKKFLDNKRLTLLIPLCIIAIELGILIYEKLSVTYGFCSYLRPSNKIAITLGYTSITSYILLILPIAALVITVIIKKNSSKQKNDTDPSHKI